MTSEHYDNAKLRELRGARSQREVAAELRIDHKKINRAENGAATYEFLCLLASHYGVPLSDLLYAVRSAA